LPVTSAEAETPIDMRSESHSAVSMLVQIARGDVGGKEVVV